MKPIEPWKTIAFGVGMLALAYAINSSNTPRRRADVSEYNRRRTQVQQSRVRDPVPVAAAEPASQTLTPSQPLITFREPQVQTPHATFGFTEPQTPPVLPPETPAEKAAKHADLVARNVNTNVVRKRSGTTIAVATATDESKLSSTVTSALIAHLRQNGTTLLSSYFKPEFVASGRFDTLFSGSFDPSRELDLTESLDGLVLAKEEVSFSTSPALENLVSASMKLRISIIRLAPDFQNQSFSFSAVGAGFRESDARRQAEERILKKVSTDATLTLNLFRGE